MVVIVPLRNILFVAFLVLCIKDTIGQVVVGTYNFSDTSVIDSSEATCAELHKKRDELLKKQGQALTLMRAKVDSLFAVNGICYLYKLKLNIERDYDWFGAITSKGCGYSEIAGDIPAFEFSIEIIEYERISALFPMHSGKIFCRYDIRPR